MVADGKIVLLTNYRATTLNSMSNNKYRVFIDGAVGTTGLQIADRLQNHPSVALVEIDAEVRKDADKKKALMTSVDLTFLCLPDAAAIEAAKLASDAGCRVIDASSAHRCAEGWVYGLPELNRGQRDDIANARFVANPGCYSTAALLLIRPLIQANILSADSPVHITGYSGYSGGGNQMINSYQGDNAPSGCALYGLDFKHKHIPEIAKWTGLTIRPSFTPCIVNSLQGMLVTIALHRSLLNCEVTELRSRYMDYYAHEQFVNVNETMQEPGGNFQTIEGLGNSNQCQLSVHCNAEYGQALLVAKLDNLGKGASGAAVQNMNIMLGLPEEIGVSLVKGIKG